MYYINNDDLWLYQKDEKYQTIDEMMKEEMSAYTLQSYAKRYDLDLSKEIIVLHSPDLGWNWSPTYKMVNADKLRKEFTELSHHEYEAFCEWKIDDNMCNAEELLRHFLSLKLTKEEVKS